MPFSSSCCASCVGHFLVYSSIKSTFAALSRRWPPKMCHISTDALLLRLSVGCLSWGSYKRVTVSLQYPLILFLPGLLSDLDHQMCLGKWFYGPSKPHRVAFMSLALPDIWQWVKALWQWLTESKIPVPLLSVFSELGAIQRCPSLPLLGEATTVLLIVGWSVPPHAIAEKCWDIR